jgi:hypothetical protein
LNSFLGYPEGGDDVSRWEFIGLLFLAFVGMYIPLAERLKQIQKNLKELSDHVRELKRQDDFKHAVVELDEELRKGSAIAERMKQTGFYDGTGKWYPPGSELPR